MTPHRWLITRAIGNDSLTNRILDLRNLSAGWHYGEGKPIDARSIRNALKLAPSLRTAGAESIEAFPEQDGGIMLSAYHGQKQLDVLILAGGGFESITIEDEVEQSHVYDEISAVENYIRGLKWRTEKLSAYFTHNTSVELNAATIDLHFEIAQQAAFRLLTTTAPEVTASRFATILRNTMGQELQVTPQFSGGYQPMHFRTPRH